MMPATFTIGTGTPGTTNDASSKPIIFNLHFQQDNKKILMQ